MAQVLPRYCPRCGAETVEGQRFCARCGLDIGSMLAASNPELQSATSNPGLPPAVSNPGFEPMASNPGLQPPVSNPGLQPASAAAPSSAQPQPPAQSQPSSPNWQSNPGIQPLMSNPGLQPAQSPSSSPDWQAPSFQQPQPLSQDQPPDRYTSLPPQSYNDPTTGPSRPPMQRRRIGMRGLILLLVLLLLFLGAIGYLASTLLGGHLGNTPSPVTTTTLNTTVTYAGVDITVLQAQQSQSFADDPRTGSDGVVRLHLQATNKATVPVNLLYTNIAHLVAPDGNIVNPGYVRSNVALSPGATQTSVIDFAVPTSTNLSRLTLRLGGNNEAQMDMPLRAGADVSQYAPQTKKLSGQMSYLGLNYSLVSATTQLSIDGRQASKGMRYITITLRIDNTLTQTAIPGSPFDYVRLRAANSTLSPVDATLPVSISAGASGQTGNVTFQVPQNSTTLTLIMLPQNQSGFDQASIDFQI